MNSLYGASILNGGELDRLLDRYECGNEGLALEARVNAANVLERCFVEPFGGWSLVKRSGHVFSSDVPYETIVCDSRAGEGVSEPVPGWPCAIVGGQPYLVVAQYITEIGRNSYCSYDHIGAVLVSADGSRRAILWTWRGGADALGGCAKPVSERTVTEFAAKLMSAVGGKYVLRAARAFGVSRQHSVSERPSSRHYVALSPLFCRAAAPVPFAVGDPFGASWFDTKEQAAKFAELLFAAARKDGKGIEITSVETEPVRLGSLRKAPSATARRKTGDAG